MEPHGTSFSATLQTDVEDAAGAATVVVATSVCTAALVVTVTAGMKELKVVTIVTRSVWT